MKSRLTLQEKLRDLREERKLTLTDVFNATGISVSTLQRLEGAEDVRVGYQDIGTLAKFYKVSADYLFGITDNRQCRNVEIDRLRLSDEAIEILVNGKINNRLISELLSHSDFPQLISSIEVYIDRKLLPQINTINKMYKFMESTIKENVDVTDDDEIITFLQQSVVDEDEYLRYRISERFNALMINLFDAHKKDTLSDEQTDVLKEMKDGMKTYLAEKENPARGKMLLLAKQLGLNLKDLSQEEITLILKALERGENVKRVKNRK